jgi:hypothetical protein
LTNEVHERKSSKGGCFKKGESFGGEENPEGYRLFLMLKWNIKAIRTSIRVKTLKAEWC